MRTQNEKAKHWKALAYATLDELKKAKQDPNTAPREIKSMRSRYNRYFAKYLENI